MIINAAGFVFQPPPQIIRARRVLIKPDASYPAPYPVSTSKEMLANIVSGIRRVSDADIIFLESGHQAKPMGEIYRALRYDFARVLMLDVRTAVCVEVENPLTHPFAMTTFWIPNIILSCDYLITVSCFKIVGGSPAFTIPNLLNLLPESKYRAEGAQGKNILYDLSIQKVIADLYFTLPFDLGIIEGQKKLVCQEDVSRCDQEEPGKIFIGDPYEVDGEASETIGMDTEYLRLIEAAEAEVEPEHMPG
ncbi:MAG: DUF362 domain-containing protein [Chloroflexi bacterium]|nr:DUF362 domain-containing protein [Chloroflexota bacterium]